MKKLKNNGLSITFFLFFLITLVGQIYTGMIQHNEQLIDEGGSPVNLVTYLQTGHFLQSTFENWESEFLQMGLYVVLTIWLFQKGSSESKPLDEDSPADRPPSPTRPGAPWPVRRGGWVLTVYENSLGIAFFALFALTFWLHALGGLKAHNTEQVLKGKTDMLTLWEFMGTSEFWFQSLQNWQSEFLSVLSIVVLSIFLRQKGSPESKPVDAADSDTGE